MADSDSEYGSDPVVAAVAAVDDADEAVAVPAATADDTAARERVAGPVGAAPARAHGGRREGGRERGGFGRRRVCGFCVDKVQYIDYKDAPRLRRFLSERGKIEPRRKTGTCAAHQRSLNVALKRARQLALLPFTAEHIRVTGVLVREPGAPPFRGAMWIRKD